MSSLSKIEIRQALVREQVLDAFEALCQQCGPRGVAMAKLVAEVGISTKTLYRLFPAKTDILQAVMQRWANNSQLSQEEGLAAGLAPKQRITNAALTWLETYNRFGAQFWLELARDFPEAQAIYQSEYAAFLHRSRGNLIGSIRPGLEPDLALSCLMALIRHSVETSRTGRLKLEQREILIQAIDLWSVGALKVAGGS